MATEKSWTCKVDLFDGRCPDGCCGHVTARVTSPTGRTVKLDHRSLPVDARARIVKAILARGTLVELECRTELTGSAEVSLTKTELQAILANEGT